MRSGFARLVVQLSLIATLAACDRLSSSASDGYVVAATRDGGQSDYAAFDASGSAPAGVRALTAKRPGPVGTSVRRPR